MSKSMNLMGIAAQNGSASLDSAHRLADRSLRPHCVEEGMRNDVGTWDAWPEIETETCGDALLTICPRPFAIFNNIFCNLADEQRIGDLLTPYRFDELPVLWWVFGSRRREELHKRFLTQGLFHAFESTMMAAPLRDDLPAFEAPDTRVCEVSNDLGLSRWLRVMTRVFEFPKAAQRPWRDLLEACHFGPGAKRRHFVASWNNIDVGCASIFLHQGFAALSNVGVLPGKRRAGIGSAVTAAALRAARSSGCRTATLLSTKAAHALYRKLGFENHGHSDCYVWTPN